MSDVAAVPLLDLRRAPADEIQALQSVAARVIESGAFILGPEVEAFEKECADYIGAPFSLGVSSGTDALLLALMALEIGPGDEVVCPTFTFFASGGAVWRVGAKPVFVDSRPCCYNLDPASLDTVLGSRTRAIMPVHLFGQCADMTAVQAIAADRGIPVIEDAAQAIGARCAAGAAGAIGLMGCVSFYPTKNLSGFGDSGLITTGDPQLRTRLDSLRVHGWGPKYYHARVGGNFRMDALQAALLRLRLPRLDELAARRRANAAFYTEVLTGAGVAVVQPSVCRGEADGGTLDLDGKIGLPAQCASDHTYNQFVIRVPEHLDRDRFRAGLAERNIGTEIYYPLGLHQQECFASLGHRPGDFPVAESAAASCLALPIFPGLTGAELGYVAEAVIEIAQRA
ncbi:MAG: DegT/DnrJ/EryC1/StrS family aminotransferase [Planctomycetes bacterium]|nr:DegT/DnrJ/EryC1/StrS family aminotransferase [Planctomycetota bacterium]